MIVNPFVRRIVVCLVLLLFFVSNVQSQPAPVTPQLAFIVARLEYGSDYERTVVELWLYDVERNNYEVLLAGDIIPPLVWSADGRYLVFEETLDYTVLDVETGERRNLASEWDDYWFFTLLADGRLVARASDGFQFVDAFTGHIVHSYPFTFENYWSQRWSPYGSYMSFASSNGYTVIETDTGTERHRFPGSYDGVWSTDEQYLYVSNEEDGQQLYAPATDELISIPFAPLVWSPDGDSFIGREADNWLMRYTIGEDRSTPFVQLDGLFIEGTWSAQHDTMAILSYTDASLSALHLQIFSSSGQMQQTLEFGDLVISVNNLVWRPLLDTHE